MDTKSSQASSPRRVSEDFNASPRNSRESHLGEAASVLLNDSKKVANELYEEGKHRIYEVQSNIKNYSNRIADRVHHRPFISLLVAGGVGFILSALFRR
ncbi:hypothetical protein [Legionella clemsonensis]|uniref:DUF883 domain-containing protein n=1 Tax=Legionella clemsonensis TaxID=1867846 RepID=A0A222P1V6_9GAMM|nr:hypothetical protein [Legionella clemsonensis]ASQ45832.1 hypothetical protein clem_06385 [Legionella clemsonensis]